MTGNSNRNKAILIVAAVGVLWFMPHIIYQNDFRSDELYIFYYLSEYGIHLPWDGNARMHFMAIRPIPMLSLLFDLQLFGDRPLGFYLINLAYHLSAAIVVLLLLKRLMNTYSDYKEYVVPLLYALVVVVHSDQFYNVLWISNRTEGMSLLLNALFMLMSVRYFETATIYHYVLAVVLLLLSLFTKAHAVALPFLFLGAGMMYYYSGNTLLSKKSIWTTALFMICMSVGYTLFWLSYDPYITVIDIGMVKTKVFSFVALLFMSIHPDLVSFGYALFFENRVFALLASIILAPVLVYGVMRMPVRHRKIFICFLILLLIAIFPRAVYFVTHRINTLQQTLFVLAVAIVSIQYGRRVSIALAVVLLSTHIVTTFPAIDRWRADSSNERYKVLLEEEKTLQASTYVLVTSQIITDIYAMHYHRYGTFGYDSSIVPTQLRLLRKPFTKVLNEYEVKYNNDCIEFVAADSRTGFLLDTTLSTPEWMTIDLHEELRDYGFRRAEIRFTRVPDSIVFISQLGHRYIRLDAHRYAE